MKNIITFLILTLSTTAFAQQYALQNGAGFLMVNSGPQNKATGAGFIDEPATGSIAAITEYSPISVQILVGTQGVGADVKYVFLPYLSGRAGFGLIPVTADNLFGFSSFSAADQLSARFSNVHFLAEYSPFENSHFRLVGGAAYFISANADVVVSPNGNYQFGNTTITKDEIGTLNADVNWRGVAPYLGVAVFKSFPSRFFNLNLDVGTYYLASPGTSLTGTKMLSDNNTQEPQFNQNMQGYHWLPVIQLNFNFRIN